MENYKNHPVSLVKYNIEGEKFYVTQEYEIDLIRGIIGKGAYGKVVLATTCNPNDSSRNTVVAIKKILLGSNKIYYERAIRELLYNITLNHINIVKCIDIMPMYEDNAIHMVLEKMDYTLSYRLQLRREIIKTYNQNEHDLNGIMDQIRVENDSWINQLLQGLNYMHHHGIIHRDLKPDNIMLIENENNHQTLKICDFGQSKLKDFDNQRMSHTQLTTPAYRPPELVTTDIKEHLLTRDVDIWAAGCIYTEMLTQQNLITEQKPNIPLQKIRRLLGINQDVLDRYSRMALVANQQKNFKIEKIRLKIPNSKSDDYQSLKNSFGENAINLLFKMLCRKMPPPSKDQGLDHFNFNSHSYDKKIALKNLVKEFNKQFKNRNYGENNLEIIDHKFKTKNLLIKDYKILLSNFVSISSITSIFNLRYYELEKRLILGFELNKNLSFQLVNDKSGKVSLGNLKVHCCEALQKIQEIIHYEKNELTIIYDLYEYNIKEALEYCYHHLRKTYSFIYHLSNTIFRKILLALYELQSNRVYHGNIKLESIRVRFDGDANNLTYDIQLSNRKLQQVPNDKLVAHLLTDLRNMHSLFVKLYNEKWFPLNLENCNDFKILLRDIEIHLIKYEHDMNTSRSLENFFLKDHENLINTIGAYALVNISNKTVLPERKYHFPSHDEICELEVIDYETIYLDS